jgi:hypothetical protein
MYVQITSLEKLRQGALCERGGELTRAGQHDRKAAHKNQLTHALANPCLQWMGEHTIPYHCLCLLCSAGNGIRPGKKCWQGEGDQRIRLTCSGRSMLGCGFKETSPSPCPTRIWRRVHLPPCQSRREALEGQDSRAVDEPWEGFDWRIRKDSCVSCTGRV